MHSNAFRSCGFVLQMIYANEIGCCLCVVCVLSVRCQCLSPLRLTFMHLPLFCLVNCTILLRVCLQAVPASVGKWSRVCTHPSPFCLKLMLADPHFLLCARCRKAHYPGVMVASHGTDSSGTRQSKVVELHSGGLRGGGIKITGAARGGGLGLHSKMTAMRKDGRAGKPKGLSEALPTKHHTPVSSNRSK